MKLKWIFIEVLLILLGSCTKDPTFTPPVKEDPILKMAKPQLKIVVMPGLNYLDPSLVGTGVNLRSFFQTEIQMEEYCKPILDKAFSQILEEKPDLLLIPGDLTFNGEKASHEALAPMLKEILTKGIKIFVVPGNQDIDNPASKSFTLTGKVTTPNINSADFESIYGDFGYNNAIARDPNSLSYVAEPFNNLWILGIDPTTYKGSYIDPYTGEKWPQLGGKIRPETIEWIQQLLDQARKTNKTVLALLHQSATENWIDEEIYAGAYVIENHKDVEDALIASGLRVVFSAHNNDITGISKGENTLFNVGTGCILTPPFAFRVINMNPNWMKIETHYIPSIDAFIPNGEDFLTYSYNCIEKNEEKRMIGIFIGEFGLPLGDITTAGTATFLAPHFSKGLLAYYYGNEKLTPEEEEFANSIMEPLRTVLKNMLTDLWPIDMEYTIDMRKKFR